MESWTAGTDGLGHRAFTGIFLQRRMAAVLVLIEQLLFLAPARASMMKEVESEDELEEPLQEEQGQEQEQGQCSCPVPLAQFFTRVCEELSWLRMCFHNSDFHLPTGAQPRAIQPACAPQLRACHPSGLPATSLWG